MDSRDLTCAISRISKSLLLEEGVGAMIREVYSTRKGCETYLRHLLTSLDHRHTGGSKRAHELGLVVGDRLHAVRVVHRHLHVPRRRGGKSEITSRPACFLERRRASSSDVTNFVLENRLMGVSGEDDVRELPFLDKTIIIPKILLIRLILLWFRRRTISSMNY